jgi:hypothetical protein
VKIDKSKEPKEGKKNPLQKDSNNLSPLIKKEKIINSLVINVKNCEYQVVRDIAKLHGFTVSTNDRADYDLMWVDLSCTGEFVSRLKPW